MNEIKLYLKSLFCKQTTLGLIAHETREAQKAFILSEKNRLYQQAMSSYIASYKKFLDEQFILEHTGEQ